MGHGSELRRYGVASVAAGQPQATAALHLQGPGESVRRFIGWPIASHPLAVPAVKNTFGSWQAQRHRNNPIGYVLMRSDDGRTVYDCYAHCRDGGRKRPWLKTFDTLNAAVAWMIQHEAELHAFNSRHDVEPDAWPA